MGNKVLTISGVDFIIYAGDVGHYTYHGHETPDINLAKAGCQIVFSGHSHTKPKQKPVTVFFTSTLAAPNPSGSNYL